MFSVSILLLGLGSILGCADAFTSIESQHPWNGVNKGIWGEEEMCADLTFATSFQIRSDGATTSLAASRETDSQGVVGLRFFCTGDDVGITSSFGEHGAWVDVRQCPSPSVMIGLQLSVHNHEERHEDHDLLGIEDVRVACQDGFFLDGLTGQLSLHPALTELIQEHDQETGAAVEVTGYSRKVVQPKTLKLGQQKNDDHYGELRYCSSGFFICGLQTRLDVTTAFDDDQGLTDVIFFCCQ